jgi:hypothetical protein
VRSILHTYRLYRNGLIPWIGMTFLLRGPRSKLHFLIILFRERRQWGPVSRITQRIVTGLHTTRRSMVYSQKG